MARLTLGVLARQFIAAGVAAALAVTGVAPPALADRNRDDQWYLRSLRIVEAQRITKGAGVIVAVIDTGVWAGHPDLDGAVLPGINVLGNGGDGRQDVDGHGTAMAGIIAARGREGGRGVLGIAPAAKILPVRPVGDTGLAADAIKWSVDHGARVINMSFAVLDAPVLQEAVRAAAEADVVLVGAAGNVGEPGFANRFPASYSQVLAVGSIDRGGKVPSFSSKSDYLDLVAPGVDVPVLDRKGTSGYATQSGTSDSAAIVSGAAALVRARYPDLPAAEVVRRLTSTAIDKGAPGRDDTYGHGSLDLMAALTAEEPSSPPAPPTDVTSPPVVSAPGTDGPSGVPLLAIGLGVLMLAGAAVATVVLVRRRGGL